MEKEILENMPTPELDELLNAELRKEIPDGDLVRTIVHVLKDRESDQPMEISPELQAVWDKYEARYQRRAERPRPTARTWVIRMASIAAIVCLLICVIPVEAQAESWWEKIAKWKSEILEIFTPQDAKYKHSEYVFTTDNEDLQQVYDAVVELGVTEPVVPMWIPDGYELNEMKVTQLSNKSSLGAVFCNGENSLILKVNILKLNNWHEYHKSDENAIEYDFADIKHHIMQNKNRWKVFWGESPIECFISFIGDEDDMYRIIQSIY